MKNTTLDIYRSAIVNQFEAIYCTIDTLIEQCPDEQWNAPVVNLRFCQAVFHVLFFSDLYLGTDVDSLHKQDFHREHTKLFGDYEELEDRPQQRMYRKNDMKIYLQHCRLKAKSVISAETESSVSRSPGFEWFNLPRAEVHLLNLRHLIHHAAQLSMRLRIDTGEGAGWVRSGWVE